MNSASSCCLLRKCDCRRRHRESDKAVRFGEQLLKFRRNRDSVNAQPCELAGVAADHSGCFGLDRARERKPLGCLNGTDERAPHAPAGTRHNKPHVGHRWSSRKRPYSRVSGGWKAALLIGALLGTQVFNQERQYMATIFIG